MDNIPYRTTPETLRRAFEKYGDVGDVYIPRDQWVYAIYYNFNNFIYLVLNLMLTSYKTTLCIYHIKSVNSLRLKCWILNKF